MRNKRNIIIAITFIILCLGIFIYYYFYNSIQNVVEILSEEEISDEQYRKTMVSLYYENRNTQKLMPEVQLIDVKLLINMKTYNVLFQKEQKSTK